MENIFLFLMGMPIVILIWVIMIYYIVSLYKLIEEMLEE